MDKYKLDDSDDDDEEGGAVKLKPGVIIQAKSLRAPKPLSYGGGGLADSNNGKDFLLGQYESKAVQQSEEMTMFRDDDLVDPEERIEDNFSSTPWEAPQFIKAEQYAHDQVYGGGVMPLGEVNLARDVEAGVAINIYFQLTRSLGIAFLFMSLLALPSLIFAYSGEGLPLQDRDVIGLSSFTIANIGYDHTASDYDVVSKCNHHMSVNGTTLLFNSEDPSEDTCVSVGGHLFTTQSVSLIITVCEALQVIAFLIAVVHFHRCIDAILSRHAETGHPSLRDYSVQVTNLPVNTTVKELLDHFSSLYQLERPDWRGRPPVEGSGPVDTTVFSGDPVFRGTWVAQCVISSRVRELIRDLEKRKHLMRQLYSLRASMKMCGLQTPHKGGFVARRWLQLERRMLRVARRVDRVNRRIYVGQTDVTTDKSDIIRRAAAMKSAAEKSAADAMKLGLGETDDLKKKQQAKALMVDDDEENQAQTSLSLVAAGDDQMEAKEGEVIVPSSSTLSATEEAAALQSYFKQNPTLTAFVTFEYNESFARCIEDHAPYLSIAQPWLNHLLCIGLCCPRQLKFKGRCLHVERAPEPDQILWESIEVSSTWKTFKRCLTWLYLLLLFACVYAGFAAAAYLRVQYQNQQPAATSSGDLCSSILPRSYYYHDTANSSQVEVDYSSFTFARSPNEKDRISFDDQCDRVIKHSYHAIYTYGGRFEEPVVPYNTTACRISDDPSHLSANGGMTHLCPSYGAVQYCPCVAQDSTEICYSSGCYETASETAADTLSVHMNASSASGSADTLSIHMNASSASGSADTLSVHMNASSKSCIQFEAADIAKCFCRHQLDEDIKKLGMVGVLTAAAVVETAADDHCDDMTLYFSASTIALLLMVPLTMLSSYLIQKIVLANISGEYYSTLDEQNAAVAWRLCIASYVNFGLIPLIAFGRSSEAPTTALPLSLLSLPSLSLLFDHEWYGTVGFYLVITFILSTFPPYLVASYFHYYCFRPWKIYYAQAYLVEQKSYRYALQSQVNKVLVDETSFDVPTRTGRYLSWVFVAMTYSAGLPALLVLAALAMVLLLRMDREFYCRFYRKQSKSSREGLGRWAASMLPFAAICKLAFSIFMLSDDSIISDQWPSVQNPQPISQGPYTSQGGGWTMQSYMHAVQHTIPSMIRRHDVVPPQLEFLLQRIFRANTFPLFVLLLAVLLTVVLREVWFLLPPALLSKALAKVVSLLCAFRRFQASENKKLLVHPYDLTFGGHRAAGDGSYDSSALRTQEAPLSGSYSKYLRHVADRPVTFYNTFCCCWSLICKPKAAEDPLSPDRPLPPSWELFQVDLSSPKGRPPLTAKMKTWPPKMQFDQGKGGFHMAGEQKSTFDLIAELHCNSYRIDRIPRYSGAGFALRKQLYSSIEEGFVRWKAEFERKNFIIGETRRQKARRAAEELQKVDKYLTERSDFKFGTRTNVKEEKRCLFQCFTKRKVAVETAPVVDDDDSSSDSEGDDFYAQQQRPQTAPPVATQQPVSSPVHSSNATDKKAVVPLQSIRPKSPNQTGGILSSIWSAKSGKEEVDKVGDDSATAAKGQSKNTKADGTAAAGKADGASDDSDEDESDDSDEDESNDSDEDDDDSDEDESDDTDEDDSDSSSDSSDD